MASAVKTKKICRLQASFIARSHVITSPLSMNKALISGLLLTIIGGVLLLIGFKGYQRQEELFRLGDYLSATTTSTKTNPAFRYVGSGCIGAGLILIFMGF